VAGRVTIREVLISRLTERFSARGLRVGEVEPFATFPAAHAAVGDVSIWDDGHEATVGLGTITHSHFDCWNTTLSDLERSEFIADEVMSFLGDLFEDRIVIWRSPDRRSSGWRTVGQSNEMSLMDEADETFVWSCPIANPLKG